MYMRFSVSVSYMKSELSFIHLLDFKKCIISFFIYLITNVLYLSDRQSGGKRNGFYYFFYLCITVSLCLKCYWRVWVSMCTCLPMCPRTFSEVFPQYIYERSHTHTHTHIFQEFVITFSVYPNYTATHNWVPFLPSFVTLAFIASVWLVSKAVAL